MLATVRILVAAGTVCTAILPGHGTSTQPAPDFARLVAQIAAADDDQSADAADQLVERMVAPLADALQGIESRPPEQQRRLLAALGRITAALRLRLFRAELPPVDQKLFDDFVGRRRKVAERLFDDEPLRRLAALRQIPLEPGTGAGVLIAATLSDPDPEVVAAGLEAAARLKDPVVARGLTRFVAAALTAAKSEQASPADQEAIAIVMADRCGQAIRVLGDAGANDSVPTILEALARFGQPDLRAVFSLGAVLEALGKLADERAAPALLELLNDREVHAVRSEFPGKLAPQTVGDVALLALLRIYGLAPEAAGFYVDPATSAAIGLPNDETRAAAVRAFKSWYRQNALKPRAERAALTTQPNPEK